MKEQIEDTVTVTQNANKSGSFQIPKWAVFCGCYFPDCDAGDIGLEWSADGTNFYPVLDPLDGSDAVVCASGADPGVFDFSDWVRFVNTNDYLRFSCASQTTAALTLNIRFRG